MGLEVANYIPELVPSNPAGSDPVSAGDDHIRNLKLAIKNTFPAFVGNTGAPKSVSLTEDQINNAALKAVSQTIAGVWTFSQPIGGVTSGNLVAANLAPYTQRLAAEPITGAWTIDGRKFAYRNPGDRSDAAASVTLLQADEGQAVRLTGAAQAVSCPVLEVFTAITIKAAGSAAGTLNGAGTTFRLFAGDAQPASVASLTFQAGAIIQLHYSAANVIDVWGSGVSV